MRATGCDPTAIKHEDLIRVQNAVDTLGDDDRSRARQPPFERILYFDFSIQINGAGAVIQNQNTWRNQQGAGDG